MVSFLPNSPCLLPTCFKYLTMEMTQFLSPSVDYFKLNSFAASNNRESYQQVLQRTLLFYFSFIAITPGELGDPPGMASVVTISLEMQVHSCWSARVSENPNHTWLWCLMALPPHAESNHTSQLVVERNREMVNAKTSSLALLGGKLWNLPNYLLYLDWLFPLPTWKVEF